MHHWRLALEGPEAAHRRSKMLSACARTRSLYAKVLANLFWFKIAARRHKMVRACAVSPSVRLGT